MVNALDALSFFETSANTSSGTSLDGVAAPLVSLLFESSLITPDTEELGGRVRVRTWAPGGLGQRFLRRTAGRPAPRVVWREFMGSTGTEHQVLR